MMHAGRLLSWLERATLVAGPRPRFIQLSHLSGKRVLPYSDCLHDIESVHTEN